MRARIEYTDPITGETTTENVRWTDEIAEAFGLTDGEADEMETRLSREGRYWLNADRCAYAVT